MTEEDKKDELIHRVFVKQKKKKQRKKKGTKFGRIIRRLDKKKKK